MRLSVTTPRGSIVEAEIDEITAPGLVGEFGVLPGHVPLMAALKPGVLTYRTAERTATLAVGEGFLQVIAIGVDNKTTDRVLVLVDQALPAASVDVTGAKNDLVAFEAELTAWKKETDGAYQALVSRRDWALAQIGAAARVNPS
jgi:F-type H+-transporting ATPase subunit epsilon